MCLDPYTTRSEDPFCRTQIELHIGQVEFLIRRFLILLLIFLTEIGTQGLLQTVVLILFRRKCHGSTDHHIAQFGFDHIGVGTQVIFDGRLHVLRILQIGWRLLDDVLVLFWLRFRDFIARARAYRILWNRFQRLQDRQCSRVAQVVGIHGIESHDQETHDSPPAIFDLRFLHCYNSLPPALLIRRVYSIRSAALITCSTVLPGFAFKIEATAFWEAFF